MVSGGLNIFSTWSVLLAAAVIRFHQFGIMRVTSFLYVESLTKYNIDRNKGSFPYVLRLMISHLAAPLVGYLGCRFGSERVVAFGCLLYSIAMGSCYFAEDILALDICWGILLGFAFALASNLFYAIVSHRYRKNVAIANGIVATGSSLGGLVYSPVCKHLLDEYGLSGTFLILSAISLNMVPAALIMLFTREISPTEIKKKHPNNVPKTTSSTSCSGMIGEKQNRINSNPSYACIEKFSVQEVTALVDQPKLSNKTFSDAIYADSFNQCTEKQMHSSSTLSFGNDSSIKTRSENNALKADYLNPGFQNSICTISLLNPPKEERKESVKTKNTSCKRIVEDLAIMDNSKHKNDKTNVRRRTSDKPKKIWQNFTIFYDPLFLFTAFVQSSFLFANIVNQTILADHIKDAGHTTSDAVTVIMCSSIADCCGRLSLSWVANRNWMTVPNFSSILYACLGIVFAVVASSEAIVGLIIFYTLAGYVLGGIMATLPTMISLQFEGDKKTMAMSNRFIMIVPMTFAISPLIGYFREQNGSYEGMYYFLTGMCFLASVILIISNFCKKKK